MAEERILLIQLRQLGDILLTTPAITAVRQQRPRATLAFLSHSMGRLVLDDNPFVDEHFFYDERWSWSQHGRFLKNLRERKFDLVIDFMNNPRSALFTLASNAHQRIAFKSARSLAYTQTVPKQDLPSYIVERKLTLLEAAGFGPHSIQGLGSPTSDGQALNLVLPWSEQHTGPLMQTLRQLLGHPPELSQAPFRVVLSPTHRREARRWPLDRYAALADWLVKRWGASILWLWGPGEESTIDQVQALCRETTIKAPKTSLRELAALIANCDLFIGNSNGPSHIAVATGIPSLQLHGHTDGAAWTPPGQGRHRFVQAPKLAGKQEPWIGDLDFETVRSATEAMQTIVESHARWLRKRGLRLNWHR